MEFSLGYLAVIDSDESKCSCEWTEAPIYGGWNEAMSDRLEKLMSRASGLMIFRECLKHCTSRKARVDRNATGSRLCVTCKAARTGVEAQKYERTFQSDGPVNGMPRLMCRIPQYMLGQNRIWVETMYNMKETMLGKSIL
jgi:hypothetical protein